MNLLLIQYFLIPNENKFGTSLITITVKDDGGVQNGGIDSTCGII